jgi:hypothetical protein
MHSITIPLTQERLTQIQHRAEQANLSPEEFLLRHVEQLLDQQDDAFHQAATYVLQKNAELYRRLS